MMNMNNIDNNNNSISYSIALDEELGENQSDKNDKNIKKDSDSIKSNKNKEIKKSGDEKSLLNKKKINKNN